MPPTLGAKLSAPRPMNGGLPSYSSLSELYDGNPPFIGRGAVSFAANVGCILRVLRLFKNLHIIDK